MADCRSAYDVDDLDKYYTDCVIGGSGRLHGARSTTGRSFPKRSVASWCSNWPGQTRAVSPRRRRTMPPILDAAVGVGYDCLIGEKLWQDRSWMWDNR